MPRDTAAGEWPHHGGDAGHGHYSPLDQIEPGNVTKLEEAWRWDSIDNELILSDEPAWRRSKFYVTPLMVGGRLYLSTAMSRAVALDARTGEQLWAYDPGYWERKGRRPIGNLHRGLTYWTDGQKERLYYGTQDAFLVALDARTGELVPEFGDGGRVDLTRGLRREVDRRRYQITSVVVIVDDVLVTSASIPDGVSTLESPPGDVRGFDIHTGKQLWTFNTVPQPGEEGFDTWENDSWKYTGAVNAWSNLSADPDLGLVYVPLGCATNNFYGGARPGDNLFSGTLVALEAATGRRVWHQQMIRHDIWDYDVPAAPNLIDIDVDGRRVEAVVQVMKNAFAYTYDRRNGEPVWPFEERAVPPSRVPGEKAAATQPFPTRPPAFDLQGMTLDDVIDFTPELRAEALEILKPYKLGGLYEPPSPEGTIQVPGYGGGGNWGGAAFDPETQRLFVPSMTLPIRVAMGAPSDRARTEFEQAVRMGVILRGPQGLPLTKPPYGRVTAIDMSSGEQVWQVPNGSGPRDHPALADLELPPLGWAGIVGLLVTGDLVFVPGRGSMVSRGDSQSPYLYVRHKRTGELLHELPLPAEGRAPPMTYELDGRQFVAQAVGMPEEPESLVVWALPKGD
jgi:quinoprotein glucose dehydrogenase